MTKELNAILAAFAASQHDAEPVFLATVVNVQGSTYRRPGARMLMTSTGKMIGTISGGCLENDVFEHTRVSMPDGQSIVVTYDTNVDQDLVWGFGLGCNGVVQILIERLEQDAPFNPLVFINQCFQKQQPGIIATVIAVEGKVKVQVGSRLILNSNISVNTDIQEPSLSAAILTDAKTVLRNQHSSFNQYQLALAKVDVFIELIKPPPHLIIFGAGSDVLPVVEFAKGLGWWVTIFDCRASEVTKERFTMVDEVILTRREMLHKQIGVDDYTIAVVMTHNYLDDLEILKVLIPYNISYLGCLGSKQRTERLLRDLGTQGVECSQKQLQKLHAPVGLDLGADTPETIALSIIAEIQAVLTNRSGGFLKNRIEPIHERH
ncbi:MAG: XdhC family protein [Symploca sp. SIO2C1]|nr:XdhC family protein [Symploca sp. SIO2C1]